MNGTKKYYLDLSPDYHFPPPQIESVQAEKSTLVEELNLSRAKLIEAEDRIAYLSEECVSLV